MKLWIARDRDGELKLFSQIPFYDELYESWFALKNDECYGFVGYLDENEIPEVTFENSPQEVELKLSNTTSKPLTRDYFANHNWEIVTHKPDENGFILWEARWIRSMEKGSPYYSDLTVTNMMYEDRFCISGKTGEGSVQYLMAYTEEDLENILKVLDIYDYYKKES